MYRPPGSCTTQFLEDFLALSGFLSSTGSSFIICGDINVHLDVECGDRSRFNDILVLWFGSKCLWPDSFTGSHSGCSDIALRLRFCP